MDFKMAVQRPAVFLSITKYFPSPVYAQPSSTEGETCRPLHARAILLGCSLFLFRFFSESEVHTMRALTTRVAAILFALAATILLPAAHAADTAGAAPVDVSYPSGPETVHALLYSPAGGATGKHPAIIVIHEWWGLNDWVKEQAADLAAHGYIALAVDLYRGQVATDPDTAHQISRGAPQDRVIRDLKAADTFLRADKHVDPSRMGAIGWCMGGGYALEFAVADPNLKAVVANYGPPPTDPASLAQIHAAILGNYGGLDKGIPPASVESFAADMKKIGKPVDLKIYPDAGHAFENPNNKTGYRAEDTADARSRYLHFFARELGGKP
jgi:carboxymethylenebutenolidase